MLLLFLLCLISIPPLRFCLVLRVNNFDIKQKDIKYLLIILRVVIFINISISLILSVTLFIFVNTNIFIINIIIIMLILRFVANVLYNLFCVSYLRDHSGNKSTKLFCVIPTIARSIIYNLYSYVTRQFISNRFTFPKNYSNY